VLRASRDPYRALPREKWLRRAVEPLKRHRAAQLYARADAVVALSAGGEAGLRRLLGSASPRIETILNPVVERTWLDGPRPRMRNPVPVVLGVGRLVPQKDFATLLRAFATLRARRPARLVLLGEGPERQRLATLAAELGIAADLDMPGEVADVAERLRDADLLVSSSLWEGMQATLIEALAAGCPVVATDCPGGARDALDDGRLGPLVPPRDASTMAAAMADQLDRPTDAKLLAEGAARFTIGGKAEAYLALFDRCRAPS
jgi:glycosyltransferase involved in cell wall biosynthesis